MVSRQLRFRRLRLKNWKNFLQVDVAVQDRMFLVGANAAGKSNLLDAFRFLRDIARPDGGFRPAVLDTRRGGVSGIRCLAARRNPDVEITVELHENGDGARASAASEWFAVRQRWWTGQTTTTRRTRSD